MAYHSNTEHYSHGLSLQHRALFTWLIITTQSTIHMAYHYNRALFTWLIITTQSTIHMAYHDNTEHYLHGLSLQHRALFTWLIITT